jgi:hypothetical protein
LPNQKTTQDLGGRISESGKKQHSQGWRVAFFLLANSTQIWRVGEWLSATLVIGYWSHYNDLKKK